MQFFNAERCPSHHHRGRLEDQRKSHSDANNRVSHPCRRQLGDKTWPIIRDFVDEIITVTEDEIRSALFLAYERMKIVLEPSAAVGIAVALGDTFKGRWGELNAVGVILCGGRVARNLDRACHYLIIALLTGNVDLTSLGEHFSPAAV